MALASTIVFFIVTHTKKEHALGDMLGKNSLNITTPPVNATLEHHNHSCTEKLVFAPFFHGEDQWPVPLRGFLYFFGLGYCFVGTAVIADVFMAAIEVITSHRRKVKVKVKESGGEVEKEFHVRTWNATVANLTLMALGSSAPEILLSLIDVVGRDFYAGELGPSTIVGSASFNLFIIGAACILAVGKETRQIKQFGVFGTTAIISVLSYVWLIVVLRDNIIEIWESSITLVFFVILAVLAFIVDKGWCNCKKKKQARQNNATIIPDEFLVQEIMNIKHNARSTKQEIATILKEIQQQHPDSNPHSYIMLTMHRLEEEQNSFRHSARYYRRLSQVNEKSLQDIDTAFLHSGSDKDTQALVGLIEKKRTKRQQTKHDKNLQTSVGFVSLNYACLDSDKHVTVTIKRIGDISQPLKVYFDTEDGTACADSDYGSIDSKCICFEPQEDIKNVKIAIIDDATFEFTEYFLCRLSNPEPKCLLCGEAVVEESDLFGAKGFNPTGKLIKDSALQKRWKQGLGTCKIVIINNVGSGVLKFDNGGKFTANESEGIARLAVRRERGADGRITVKYRTCSTTPPTAIAGVDYEPIPKDDDDEPGLLVFDAGETLKTIEIKIFDDEDYEKDESFLVELFEPQGGATFDPKTDGQEELEIAEVTIVSDDGAKELVDGILNYHHTDRQRAHAELSAYRNQFREACVPPKGKKTKCFGKLIYFLFVAPWKFLFAIVPPPNLWRLALLLCFVRVHYNIDGTDWRFCDYCRLHRQYRYRDQCHHAGCIGYKFARFVCKSYSC